jgi:hypothetical protein
MEMGNQLHTSALRKSLHYTLHRRLNEPKSQSGCCDEERIYFPCQELNPDFSAVQSVD